MAFILIPGQGLRGLRDMSTQIKALVAAATLTVFPLIAQAADLKAPPVAAPVPTWTGWYVGINAGYAWGESEMQTHSSVTGAAYFAGSSRAAINATGLRDVDVDGFTGGVQFGYLLQFGTGPFGGNWVIGFEADANYLGLKESSTIGPITYPAFAPSVFTHTGSIESDWLFTLRARYGVAYGNWLFYSTAGFALARIESAFTFRDNFPPGGAVASASGEDWAGGYVFGSGIEMMFMPRWTLRAEYLFVRLDNVSIISNNLVFAGVTFPGEFFTHRHDLSVNIVRAALNYRF
jgi:outer membrane immunogenic protein